MYVVDTRFTLLMDLNGIYKILIKQISYVIQI